MKTFGLKTIGTFILIISIMYPINIMFNEGYTLKMALFGGVGNFTLLSEIGFVVGIILIITSLFKNKSKLKKKSKKRK